MDETWIFERDMVLEAVQTLLDGAPGGRGGSLFLVAEAGLGKTTLLEAAAALVPSDWDVGRARGEIMETSLSFGVLSQLAASLEDRGLLEVPGGGQALDPGAPYHRALRWLEARGDRPLAILVDDLHWADPDSLRVLGFLARRLSDHAVVLLAAMRPWPRAAEDLGRHLEIGGAADVERLEPLSRGAAADLLALRSGSDVPRSTEALAWELCQGNPLLVEQVALRVTEDGGALTQGDTGASVGRLLLARFAGLDEATFTLVRCGSVLGTGFRPEVAATMAALGEDVVDRALQALSRSGLAEEGGGGLLRFAHPLFAQAVYDDLSAPERDRLHRRAFTALADRGLDGEAAEHAAQDALAGDERALAILDQAGAGALVAGAVDTAARHIEAAVRLTRGPLPTSRHYLLCAALTASGRMDEAATACRSMLDRPGLLDRESLDVLQMLGRTQLTRSGDHGEAAHAQAVETALWLDPARAVTALLDQAFSAWMADGPARALPLVEQARSLAPDTTDADERERAEVAWGYLRYETGHADGLDAVASIRRFLDDPTGTISLDAWEMTWPWARLYNYAMTAVYAEHHDDAAAAFRLGRMIAERVGAANALSMLAIYETSLALRTGDLRRAQRESTRALEFGDLTQGASAYGLLARAETLLWVGDDVGCLAACHQVAEAVPDDWFAGIWQAHILGQERLWAGDVAAASAHLATAQALTERSGIREPCHVMWQGRAAEAHARAGREKAAEGAVAWTRSAADRLPCRWPAIAAAVGAAHLALARGDELAIDGFDTAVALHDAVHLPLQRAELQLGRGRALLRFGRMQDARVALRDAEALARRHGAGGLVRVIEVELARSGSRRARATPPDVLSPAQLASARLAASGSSNAEIAATMHITINTVETHLRRAYRKLGIRSRRDLPHHLTDVDPT